MPLSWYVPLPHTVQNKELAAPVMLVYCPTPHDVQDASPGWSAYSPMAHEPHTVAPEETPENEPARHTVQVDAPVVRSLYEPTAQDVHTDDDSAEATLLYAPAPQPVQPPVLVLSAL